MKTTLITGAGRGIGLSIAEKFYKENHKLILLVRDKAQEKKLKKKFNKNQVKIFSGDLSNYNFIKKISSKIKYVNNLINNAGTRNSDHFHNVKKKDFDYLLELNFKSIYFLTQFITKKMVKYNIKGSIINLSSQLGHLGAYNRTAYCSSKFAIEGFTKSTALDLSKFGIRINSIAPTKTISEENNKLNSKKRLNLIKKKIPLKTFTQKEDIAKICFFLTSSASKNITGTSIKVDGGWTAGF
ncbi:SDR family NAD(P)-dependent oxidoreductase [Candidatus Pelagibacter sp.]|nr:SDR family NAD(P)-dependent oxidoreductase [Candidatus Pelagibacter sp.]